MILVLRLSSDGVFIQRFEKNLRPHLQQYFTYINHEIGIPPNLQKAKQLSETLNIKIILTGPDLNWSSDGSFPDQSQFNYRAKHKYNFRSGHYKHKLFFITLNQSYKTTLLTQNNSNLPTAKKILFNSLLGVFLVLGLLYFFLRRMISPIKNIQKSVKRIGSGDLNHRINIKRNDELGKLSKEINAMTDDIENMLEAKRQLLLAISHELRSPITRAKVAASLMEKGQLKEGIESDLDEMEAMISGLLEAEQLNHRHQVLNINKVKVTSLITTVITQYFPDETIQQKLENKINTLNIDEARFQFIIKNLLGNALKYRKQKNDAITISSKKTENNWILSVEDQGIGIPEKHLTHLTEPFYRVDPSRHRETGGYGLGLYIIKMIVDAHNGELNIESKEGIGTKVVITIPF